MEAAPEAERPPAAWSVATGAQAPSHQQRRGRARAPVQARSADDALRQGKRKRLPPSVSPRIALSYPTFIVAFGGSRARRGDDRRPPTVSYLSSPPPHTAHLATHTCVIARCARRHNATLRVVAPCATRGAETTRPRRPTIGGRRPAIDGDRRRSAAAAAAALGMDSGVVAASTCGL